MIKLIFLDDISIKDSPRVRDHIDGDVVAEYALCYKENAAMPPPQLFEPKGAKYLLVADGLHRIEANRMLKRKAMKCDVLPGGFQDALKHALTCNTRHGLRRTTADKRRCVESALREWPKNSDNQIASLCGVDHKTVAVIRSGMEEKKSIETTETRQGADGKTYKKPNKPKFRLGNSQPAEKKDNKGSSSPVDETGYPIPKALLPLWERRPEVAEVLSAISFAKCHLEKADKSNDPLWREPFLNKAIADLENVYGNLSTAKPYAVCGVCEGHPETQPNGECRGCKGTGFMSKFRWERVPEKIRNMRSSDAGGQR